MLTPLRRGAPRHPPRLPPIGHPRVRYLTRDATPRSDRPASLAVLEYASEHRHEDARAEKARLTSSRSILPKSLGSGRAMPADNVSHQGHLQPSPSTIHITRDFSAQRHPNSVLMRPLPNRLSGLCSTLARSASSRVDRVTLHDAHHRSRSIRSSHAASIRIRFRGPDVSSRSCAGCKKCKLATDEIPQSTALEQARLAKRQGALGQVSRGKRKS